MAVDNKVSIEIVLDDGSVKRGFATIKKESEATGKDFEKNLNQPLTKAPGKITDIAASLFLVQQAIGAAGIAFQKAFDFVLVNEKARAAEIQFRNLANSAGLFGNDLANSLENAADGLIETGDLLQAASVRVTQLGENAARLPEVLEAARRVAFATGQDLLTVFDGLANGIATGNERAFRQFGLILDLKTATDAYALSIGTTSDKLTDQQRQAVALEATVKQIGDRFGGVDQSLTPISVAFERLTVQVKELFGAIGEGAATGAASPLASFFNTLTSAAESSKLLIESNIDGQKGLRAEIELTAAGIAGLQEKLAVAQEQQNQAAINTFTNFIAQEQARLKVLQDRQAVEAEDERRRTENLRADAVLQDLASQATARNVEALRLQNEERKKAEEQAKKNADAEAALTAQIQTQTGVIEANQVKFGEASVANLSAYETFANGFTTLSQAIQAEARNQTLTYGDLARTISVGFSGALASAGAAFASGANAAQSFGNSVLKIIGQLAIQLGQFYIAAGIAQQASAFLFGSGSATIAAGSALVVLGGALQASAGSAIPQSTVGAGAGGTGGELNTPSTDNLFPPGENDRERGPNTVINVSFEGDVIGDSADTGSRIVSLINDAFDKQGVVLRQGVV